MITKTFDVHRVNSDTPYVMQNYETATSAPYSQWVRNKRTEDGV